MKKTFVSLLVVGLLSSAAISPAAAAGTETLVKVPFQFIVGDKVMPSGTYRIATQTNDWSVVLVTSVDTPVMAFTSTEIVPKSGRPGTDAQLSFTNYSGHYFLQQIAIPGRSARRVVTREQAERTLTKLNLLPAERAQPAR